jgi:Zn-dependent peptidase ImmA (M78 family)/transcriptional regulator with XRE-family HTH domain
MINGRRIRQARELHRLTQGELAQALNIAQSTVAHIESGRWQPTDAISLALAEHLHFPQAFFEQPDPPEFSMGSLLFRGPIDMAAADINESYRYGETIFEAAVRLSKKERLKMKLTLPVLNARDEVSPQEAAQLARTACTLSPDSPIKHLMACLERLGILVLASPMAMPKREAFSLWNGLNTLWASEEVRKPIIVVFGNVPGDRLRFSLAHEFGHLVLHQGMISRTKQMEDEANQFASELLMPESAMRQRLIPPVTLPQLAELKLEWKVSVSALLMRTQQLEIITPRRFQYLRSQMQKLGWLDVEPHPIALEKPRGLRQMAEMGYGNPVDYHRLAQDLCWDTLFTRQVIEAHATNLEYKTMGKMARAATPGTIIPFTPSRQRRHEANDDDAFPVSLGEDQRYH